MYDGIKLKNRDCIYKKWLFGKSKFWSNACYSAISVVLVNYNYKSITKTPLLMHCDF